MIRPTHRPTPRTAEARRVTDGKENPARPAEEEDAAQSEASNRQRRRGAYKTRERKTGLHNSIL